MLISLLHQKYNVLKLTLSVEQKMRLTPQFILILQRPVRFYFMALYTFEVIARAFTDSGNTFSRHKNMRKGT